MGSFIKDYQTLIGSFLGVIFPIGFWFIYKLFEKREAKKDAEKEVEKIFYAAIRECVDSVNNTKFYIESIQKNIKPENKSIYIPLPPELNKIEVNEPRLAVLSKNLHHLVSQQIDIATSAAKKFNGWLVQCEKTPAAIFDSNIKVLQAGLETKEAVIKDYYDDLARYANNFIKNIETHSKTIQLHLLRPIMSIQENEKDLDRLFAAGELEDFLDTQGEIFLTINKNFQ